jgi:hypothetical protein
LEDQNEDGKRISQLTGINASSEIQFKKLKEEN